MQRATQLPMRKFVTNGNLKLSVPHSGLMLRILAAVEVGVVQTSFEWPHFLAALGRKGTFDSDSVKMLHLRGRGRDKIDKAERSATKRARTPPSA